MKAIAKQIGAILFIGGVAALLANTVHPRRIPWVQDWSIHAEAKARQAGVKVVPLSVALQKFQEGQAVFIDARPAKEFREGRIPGAVSVPFQNLDDHFLVLGELVDSGKELVLYCKSRGCDDGLMLAKELQAMGATKLVLYIDGFELWEKHGGAVEQNRDQRSRLQPATDAVGGIADPASEEGR
jgi:rhodanese-related sulfurtransferase